MACRLPLHLKTTKCNYKIFNNLPWIEKEEKIAEKKCAKIQTQIVKTWC